ncbi:MAG: hypothetical protein QM533_13090 [Cytophagales bacterium]|nr:hypothetical protein [Cytophagales bacterium]
MTFNSSFFTRTLLAAITSALLLAQAAQAHETHGKPQHGGVVAEAATFQAELVVKQTTALIYLSDHGKEVSSKGVTGKLTVLTEGKTYTVNLVPHASNQLKAVLTAPLKSGKFAGQITLPNKPAVSIRFELK